MRKLLIFHRHGHRAPYKQILYSNESQTSDVDVKRWRRLLPSVDFKQKVSNRFELRNYNTNDIARDIKTHPYGCVTKKGLEHTKRQGELASKKFLRHLDTERDVLSYSTNYERTQLSGLSFMSGFLPDNECTDKKICTMNVRNAKTCSMSFYDKNQSEIVKAREIIGKVLPVLSIESAVAVAEEKHQLDWLGAYDYFACNDGHDVEVHNDLKSLRFLVKDHMCARYAQYYKKGTKLLSCVVAPLLFEIITAFELDGKKGKDQTGVGENNLSLTFFSGHDVTLLSLLYSLNAQNVSNISSSPSSPSFWPDYSTYLTFEYLPYEDTIFIYWCDEHLIMKGGRRSLSSEEFLDLYSSFRIL